MASAETELRVNQSSSKTKGAGFTFEVKVPYSTAISHEYLEKVKMKHLFIKLFKMLVDVKPKDPELYLYYYFGRKYNMKPIGPEGHAQTSRISPKIRRQSRRGQMAHFPMGKEMMDRIPQRNNTPSGNSELMESQEMSRESPMVSSASKPGIKKSTSDRRLKPLDVQDIGKKYAFDHITTRSVRKMGTSPQIGHNGSRTSRLQAAVAGGSLTPSKRIDDDSTLNSLSRGMSSVSRLELGNQSIKAVKHSLKRTSIPKGGGFSSHAPRCYSASKLTSRSFIINRDSPLSESESTEDLQSPSSEKRKERIIDHDEKVSNPLRKLLGTEGGAVLVEGDGIESFKNTKYEDGEWFKIEVGNEGHYGGTKGGSFFLEEEARDLMKSPTPKFND